MIQKKRPTSRTQSVNDVGRYYEKFHQHWAQYICAQRGICCLTYWRSSVVLAFVVQVFIVPVFICHVGVRSSCGHSLCWHSLCRHSLCGCLSCRHSSCWWDLLRWCSSCGCLLCWLLLCRCCCGGGVHLLFICCAGVCRVGVSRAGIHLLGWRSLVVLAFVRCAGFRHACACPFIILAFVHCAAARRAGICVHADADAAVRASVVVMRVDSY